MKKSEMDHVAYMKKSWLLIPKILSGEKKVESRWYKSKRVPWDKVKTGDTIYFKNSGEKVTAKANAEKVLQFDNLTPEKVKDLRLKYFKEIGIEDKDNDKYYELFKEKKYCILIYLKNAVEIEKSFEINKKGYGNAAAWISVNDINEIIIKN